MFQDSSIKSHLPFLVISYLGSTGEELGSFRGIHPADVYRFWSSLLATLQLPPRCYSYLSPGHGHPDVPEFTWRDLGPTSFLKPKPCDQNGVKRFSRAVLSEIHCLRCDFIVDLKSGDCIKGTCVPQHFTLRSLRRYCPECSVSVTSEKGKGEWKRVGRAGARNSCLSGRKWTFQLLRCGSGGLALWNTLGWNDLDPARGVHAHPCVCVCVCVCVCRRGHRGDGGKPFPWKLQNLSFSTRMWEVTQRVVLCSWHLTSGSLCSFRLCAVWFFCTYTWPFS